MGKILLNHQGRLFSADANDFVQFRQTPNRSTGTLAPRFIIIHYTAGRSFQSSVNWLCNPKAKASAHIVIGRSGEVAQLAEFDQITWHAGISSWRVTKDDRYSLDVITNLNRCSIGIELDNPGLLETRANGSLRTWYGADWLDDSAIWATHKNWGDSKPRAHWAAYTSSQLLACEEICELLVDRFDIEDILGHDDIAPGRKIDPGPAFPMDRFRAHLFGRPDTEADDDAR